MRVLLTTEFAVSRKEPLVEIYDRILAAFQTSAMGEATVRFSFADMPVSGSASSMDRVLQRFPVMQSLLSETQAMPPFPAMRRISNQGTETRVDAEILRAILAGVPRSFPFHEISLEFTGPDFGEGSHKNVLGEISPGITLGDCGWINGRIRSLNALTIAEADGKGKNLPPFPDRLAALFAALGKAKKMKQLPLREDHPEPFQVADPERLAAVRKVVETYRAALPQILERVAFPHELPPVEEARRTTGLGATTGPKKPALLRTFQPMGYDCNSGSGTFTLRRRTANHLTLEVSLDVGTWSRSLSASYSVHGPGFSAPISLPVSRNAAQAMQYPIGDAKRWRQLVENMAAFVQELEASFVPSVEAAAGPAPEWFTRES